MQRSDFNAIEVIASEYVPAGVALIRYSEGAAIMDFASGKGIRLPNFAPTLPNFELPREFTK